MEKEFLAHRFVGRAAFALTVLLLTNPVLAQAPAVTEPLPASSEEVEDALSAKIMGRIVDASTGRGVPGVVVKVERYRDGRRWLSPPTDASGHYVLTVSFADPEGEVFRARTLAFDYADDVGSGAVFPGQPLTLDFRLALRPTAILRGTVLDADSGIPVSDATVAVSCPPPCNGISHPLARTGPDGRFELPGVPFSASGPVENATSLEVSRVACPASGRSYPPVANQVDVNESEVSEDFRVKSVSCSSGSTAVPFISICSGPACPPPSPLPPCAGNRNAPTVDNHGRLVTSCLPPANETDVAWNPANPLNIVSVAKDYALGLDQGNTCADPLHPSNVWEVWIGVYTSFDHGVSWTNDLLPGFPGDNRSTGVPNQRCMSDPVVAFTPNGELYLAALAWGAPVQFVASPVLASACTVQPCLAQPPPLALSDLVVAHSKNGGRTWDSIQSIYTGLTTGQWPDKPELAVDPDYRNNHTVYVAWDLVTEPTPPSMLRSSSPRLTTIVNMRVTHVEGIPGIDGLPMPAVLKDHSVVVSGWGSACTDCIAVSRRTSPGNWAPNGSTAGDFDPLGQTTGTTDDYRADVIPTLAVDRSVGPRGGNVAVAWHTGGNRVSSLKVAYSADVKNGGSTWSSVDPPLEASGALQILPRVAVSPVTGVVGLLYYEDTLSGPTPLSARYLAGTRGGSPALWGTPVTLSVPFSPINMFHQTDEVFIGDYVGLTFDSGGNALATWADGRNNRSDTYFESVPETLTH